MFLQNQNSSKNITLKNYTIYFFLYRDLSYFSEIKLKFSLIEQKRAVTLRNDRKLISRTTSSLFDR